MSVKYLQTILCLCQTALSSGVFSCSPQIAVTLLVHKIHSPQEWEALQALTVRNPGPKISQPLNEAYNHNIFMQVLEACMKNCGRRFHKEVGKYRFLNELIKVVSPKVSGLEIYVSGK